jgi:hypothetical protein
MSKMKKSIVAGIAILAFSSNANAGGYPVFDAAANGQLTTALGKLGGIIAGQATQTTAINGMTQMAKIAVDTKKAFEEFKNQVYGMFGGTGALAREVVENCVKMPSIPGLDFGVDFNFGLSCVQGHLLKGLGLDQLLSFKVGMSDIIAGDMKSSQHALKKKADSVVKKNAELFANKVNASSGTPRDSVSEAEIKKSTANAAPTFDSTSSKARDFSAQAEAAKIDEMVKANDEFAHVSRTTNPAQAMPTKEEKKRVEQINNISNEDEKVKAMVKFNQETGKDFQTILSTIRADSASNYGDDKMVGDKILMIPTIKAEGKGSGGNVPKTSLMIEGSNIANYEKIKKAYVDQLKEVEKAAQDATSSSATNKNAGGIDVAGLEKMIDNVGVTPMTASILAMVQSGTVMSNIVVDANRRGKSSNGEPSAMSDGQKAALSTAQAQGIIMQLVLMNQNIFEMNKLLAELSASQHAATQQKLNDINHEIKQIQLAIEYLNSTNRK